MTGAATTDTHALLTEATRRSPVPVTTTDLIGTPLPVARGTRDALLGAVAEALRNVERHASRPEATITLAWSAPGVAELSVRNEGPPRHPGDPTPGFGIRHSIETPMLDVGGSARVEIHADASEVVLGWPVEAAAEQPDRAEPLADVLTRLGALTRLPPVRLAVLPMLLAQCYLGFTNPWAGAPLAVNTAAVLTGVVITWGLVHLLEFRHPSQSVLLAAGLAISGLTAGSVAVLGADTLSSFQSWQVGFASLPLAVIAFHVSLRSLAAVVLPLPLLLSVVVTVAGLPLWRAAGALNTAVLPLFAGATAAGLRVAIRRAERQHRTVLKTAAVAASREAHEAAARRHLGRVRAEILPWLSGIADGRVDLADPETARLARVHAWGARDDLYAPEFFDDALRRSAAEFRSGGGRLVVRPGVHGGPAMSPTADLLDTLLREARDTATITVTEAPDVGARVVVSPGLATDRLQDLPTPPGFVVSGDAYATEFRTIPPTTGGSGPAEVE